MEEGALRQGTAYLSKGDFGGSERHRGKKKGGPVGELAEGKVWRGGKGKRKVFYILLEKFFIPLLNGIGRGGGRGVLGKRKGVL